MSIVLCQTSHQHLHFSPEGFCIMTHDSDIDCVSTVAAKDERNAWEVPSIIDADISALTTGGGTSGIEGTSFLKAGS